MEQFAQQIVSGLATGSIFASMALALVLIYRSMGVINFAQGEMAMFTTFIAWQLVANGMPRFEEFPDDKLEDLREFIRTAAHDTNAPGTVRTH